MERKEARESLEADLRRYNEELREGRGGEPLREKVRLRREASVARIENYIKILDSWDFQQPKSVIDLSDEEKRLINAYEISDVFRGQFAYMPV